MRDQREKIRQFLLENIEKEPKQVVALAVNKFKTSRVTVLRHMDSLIQGGKVLRTGKNKGTLYSLAESFNKELVFKIQPGVEEHEIWKKHLEQNFRRLPEIVFNICSHGFHEIFNNALEHSQGNKIIVKIKRYVDDLEIVIHDNGIGIFKKIKEAFSLANERESLLRLSQGKVTTDPKRHTGEGIFFTSRIFDEFKLVANSLSYVHQTLENDWFIESLEQTSQGGTLVSMKIRADSTRKTEDVFKQFTNPETFEFDKTNIKIELSKTENELYISRSQARRILAGASRFKHIVLDFQKVKTIGQAFVDEVFRVFKNDHPDITIEYINANEDVKFMLERGLATATPPELPLK